MSDWDWTQALDKPLDTQRQTVERIHFLLDGPGQAIAGGWQELKPAITDHVLVKMREWISTLRDLGRPLALRDLRSERGHTRRFARTIGLQPRALGVKLQIIALWATLVCRKTWARTRVLATALWARIVAWWRDWPDRDREDE
jgi:hypothetical protein